MISNIECHYCYQKISSSNFHAKCCMKKCNKHYCISCICKHFDTSFDPSQYKKETWICYHCQEKCNCQPKQKKKLGKVSVSKANQEEQMYNNSNNKSMDPLDESQQAQNNVIKDYQTKNKMLISRDDIILMPFFMQRLAKRRNMYYDFMSKEQKGSSDKIKNMVQQALREGNYSEGSDDQLEIIE